MKSRKRIPVAYVIGAYRAPSQWATISNIRAAEAIAVQLWQLGFAVICPHLNSFMMSGATDEEVFLEGYREILSRCDLVVVAASAVDSDGSRVEVLLASMARLPVVHWVVNQDDASARADIMTEATLTKFLIDYRAAQGAPDSAA